MKKIFRQDSKQARGSALVFALVVMFIILTAALGVASVSVIDQKNSSVTGKSTQAFQVADSAIEMVLKRAVTDPQTATLSSLGTCTPGGSGNPAKTTINVSGNTAIVTFEDVNGSPIEICGANLSQVALVKAVATYSGTTRAISSAVAAGTLNWVDITNFGSGWQNFVSSSGYYPAQCAKDSRTGIVYLRGVISHGTWPAITNAGGTVFTLPTVTPSVFPAKAVLFNTRANDSAVPSGSVRMDIHNTGMATIYAHAAGWISLDGISFPTN